MPTRSTRTILNLVPLAVSMALIGCTEKSSGPATGSLSIASTPAGASVTLDNASTGRVTPTTFEAVAAGQHSIKLTLSSYIDTSVTAVVAANAMTSTTVLLRSAFTSTDSVFIRIQVSQLPATLTFNQSHVPLNRVEYWWGILFNTDGNATTGFSGFDIEIALAHANMGGAPFEASPVDGAWHQVIEWVDEGTGLRGYVRHQEVVARIDPGDANTLVAAAPRSWPEIARIDELDSVYVRTTYFAPTPPPSSDRTSAALGAQPIADPAGDVPYGLNDIVLGGWSPRQAFNPSISHRLSTGARAGQAPAGDRRAQPMHRWSNGVWLEAPN